MLSCVPFDYADFNVDWMVETDPIVSGQIRWVQFPWDTEKRLEHMYLDDRKGVDDYVA